MITAVAFVMFLVLIVQAPSLYIYKKWKELAFYLLYWALATAYALLVISPVELPAPSRLIITLMCTLQDFFVGTF